MRLSECDNIRPQIGDNVRSGEANIIYDCEGEHAHILSVLIALDTRQLQTEYLHFKVYFDPYKECSDKLLNIVGYIGYDKRVHSYLDDWKRNRKFRSEIYNMIGDYIVDRIGCIWFRGKAYSAEDFAVIQFTCA